MLLLGSDVGDMYLYDILPSICIMNQADRIELNTQVAVEIFGYQQTQWGGEDAYILTDGSKEYKFVVDPVGDAIWFESMKDKLYELGFGYAEKHQPEGYMSFRVYRDDVINSAFKDNENELFTMKELGCMAAIEAVRISKWQENVIRPDPCL